MFRKPTQPAGSIGLGDHPESRSAQADRSTRDASITLALTLPTDTVLYLLLPLHAASFEVTLAEAGLLLAANRLVRIIGYGWVAKSYELHGPRIACVGATLGSVAASLGYALLPGVWWLLAARLIWGLSFAAMNIATQALATAEATGAVRRSGRSRAVIAAGPMVSLIVSAFLAAWYGPQMVFVVLAGVAVMGLPFAWRLPSGRGEAVRGRPRFGLPSRLDTWSFTQGLTLDGLFVFGLSVLAAASLPQGAVLAAASALALRYASEVTLGPVGGRLGERFGSARMLILLSLTSALGLCAIGLDWLWAGAVLIVLLRGLIQPLPPPVVAAAFPGPERVPALARFATWRDLGAGVGPLIAGSLLPVLPPSLIYGVAAVRLAVVSVALRRMVVRG